MKSQLNRNLKVASLACTAVLAGMMPSDYARAQSPEAPAKPAAPARKSQAKAIKISENVYQIGKVTFNRKTREITIPCVAEKVGDEVIEYVLVHNDGKIHESLFTTDVTPSHINIAFKLLGYKEAKHLFRVVNENFQPQEEYETATDEEKHKSKFKINVSWKVKGKEVSYPMEDLIINPRTNEKLENTPWVYGGSFIYRGQYAADLNKDIIAVFTDRAAIANYAGKGRENDTLWRPNAKILPRYGTVATITFSPNVEKVDQSKTNKK